MGESRLQELEAVSQLASTIRNQRQNAMLLLLSPTSLTQ